MPKTICKTVCQYNSAPVPAGDMEKLLEIAKDYRKVKAYVYQRYGGISGLCKLYPGYEIQNEMTASGFRGETGIPSVYFYLAIFDALSDIRGQWTIVKNRIRKLVGKNEDFTAEEKHYLRFVLKADKAFAGVLVQKPPAEWGMKETSLRQYNKLEIRLAEQQAEAGKTSAQRLKRYLRRQARRYYTRPQARAEDGFSLSKSTCRYGDHGIYISTKESRKRVFIPLTDGNTYKSQPYLKLYPLEGRIELRAAVRVRIHIHPDYNNHVEIRFGNLVMLTTREGHLYGEHFGTYWKELADIAGEPDKNNGKNENAAGKKYNAKLSRAREHFYSYVNMELNRFLREEKPAAIYLIQPPLSGKSIFTNEYVRDRLVQKCLEHSVRIVKI